MCSPKSNVRYQRHFTCCYRRVCLQTSHHSNFWYYIYQWISANAANLWWKDRKSIPKFQFTKSFALRANPKHFSNTDETLIKLIDQIIVPYFRHERENLQLQDDHPALLILDVFSGQMTRVVLDKLQDNNIHLVRVPPNMTNLFQPLDLTVNRAAKAYMKRRFTEWYSNEIWKELEAGKDLDDIDVKLTLTILKPLHARWLVDLYDYRTSSKGSETVNNGCQFSGITGAIVKGTNELDSLDPFASVDPLETNDSLQDQGVVQAT